MDRRCWRYRRGDDGEVQSKLFNAPELVPEGYGWTDSPANLEPVAVNDAAAQATEGEAVVSAEQPPPAVSDDPPKRKRGRPRKNPEPEQVEENGDG
jgi:hypothetical protein